MTAATDEDAWIQGSLARVEVLEAQRAQLAARGQTAELAEVDEELRALYEVLESAAGEEEQAPANTGMALGMAPAPGMGMAPPPGMGMAPPPGMGMAPAPGMGMVMAPMPMSSSLEAMEAKRSPMPFIIAGVVAVVVGVGAIVALGGSNEKEAKAEPTEPAKVIKAGQIAEDTQEPVVAKGADADRTSGTKYRESPRDDRSDVRRPSSGGNSGASRPRPTKEDGDGRKITVEKTRDPLAGID
jgi:hypothetical protein